MAPAGDDRRYCSRCCKHVHFLSGMTQARAMRVLDEHRARGERVCIRYQVESDGSVRFRPQYEPGFVRGAAMLAAFVLMLTACDKHEAPLRIDEPSEAPPIVWVELEPKPVIPDLPPLIKPAIAVAKHPTRPKRVKRKTQDVIRLGGVHGDYEFWDW